MNAMFACQGRESEKTFCMGERKFNDIETRRQLYSRNRDYALLEEFCIVDIVVLVMGYSEDV